MTAAEARDLCLDLYLKTIEALQVGPRLRQRLRLQNGVLEVAEKSYPLSRSRLVRIVSFGKAAIDMAETSAEILAGANIRGIVVAPVLPKQRLRGFEYFQAEHPYPDQQSWRAAEAVLQFLGNRSPADVILFLVSGGGSALLEKPLDPSVSLDDVRQFYKLLVTCGASIEEINILRKHLSAVKGGRLAAVASPATQITLYVSDVPEHLPSAVASGPTMPDQSTIEDCRRIAAQYGLVEKLPASIRGLLMSGKLAETPKQGHPSFARSEYYCLLSNRDAIEHLLQLAEARGLRAKADTSCDECPVQRAGDHLLARLEEFRQEQTGSCLAVSESAGEFSGSVLLISGGELSSPVPETVKGRGGRNQALVLECIPKIARQRIVVLSAGTDGIDGNSPAAGAIGDGTSTERAAALGLDPEKFLSESDSYCFFEKLGDAIVTGPTGTNVRDIRMLLAYS